MVKDKSISNTAILPYIEILAVYLILGIFNIRKSLIALITNKNVLQIKNKTLNLPT